MTSEIIPYASRTGTKRNLASLRRRGWRLLVSATGVHRTEGFPYALENGAFTAYQDNKPFNESRFETLLKTLGAGADWCAVPDIVGGGLRSLELSRAWLARVLSSCQRALICVQDGMTVADVADLIGPTVGIFVGGSPTTTWKLDTMGQWSKLAASRGAWCHVGRVNSAKRIGICQRAGVTSFDGTNATKFSVNHPSLNAAVRQRQLFPPETSC